MNQDSVFADNVDNVEAVRRFDYYRKNPWAFVIECCFTKDQTNKKAPIALIPDWPYLRLYTKIRQEHQRLAVPKSRRMTMSWTTIALYLHDTIFFPVRDQAFVSKKEEDAAELVRRAEFIYDHIPESRIPKSLLPRKETRAKPAALSFPELQSKIQGFPMGADQLRQFTFSGIFGDESAFWEDAQKFYSSAYPTIEGGGRMDLVSSRSPSFFQRLVYDQLDNTDPIDENVFPAPIQDPFGDDSVRFWVNPKNKFAIFDIHYTANPNKREPGFKEAIRSSMPIKDFMVEYERNWEAYDGTPVFEDYSRLRHELTRPDKPHLGLPLLCGWDFGLTPACIVAQLRGSQLFVLREFVSQHKGIKQFAPEVMAALKQYYPEWSDQKKDFRHYIDPAGLHQAQTDQRTCALEMSEAGLRNIFPGAREWEPRRSAVEHFLISHDKNGAALQIFAGHAPKLAKGFAGAYRYPERYQQLEPGKPKPIKDEYCVDGLTQILTFDGWKYFNELSVGTPIYEYDIEKDCLVEGSIKNIIHSFDGGNFLALQNTKHDLRMTPQHRCVIRHKESKEIDVVYAKDLKQGHLFFSPKGINEPKKKQQVSDSFVELAAWVMTEGTRRQSGAYILSQSFTHNPTHVAYLDQLVATFEGCFRKTDTADMAHWHLRGNVQFMLNELQPGKNKIPSTRLIRMMNNSQRRLYIYTAMCGDGDCASKLIPGLRFGRNRDLLKALPVARIRLKHKAQVNALQMMATLCGLTSSVLPNKDGMWSFTLSTKHAYADYQGMKVTEYRENFFWCPQTEMGTWIMRRNGRVYVTGNSHPHDAFQYLCSGAVILLKGGPKTAAIPTPYYSTTAVPEGEARGGLVTKEKTARRDSYGY